MLEDILKEAVKMRASDIHIKSDAAPVVRVDGELSRIGDCKLNSEDIKIIVKRILGDNLNRYYMKGEYDVGYELKEGGRFRINIFKERGKDSISIRVINNEIYPLEKIGVEDTLREFIKETRGLILVSGSTGSGKSTTIASMIEEINRTEAKHIITLEEPVEYIYKDKKSIITQREIGKDTMGYEEGLRAALREDPDVILIGEMRDFNTINMAITAAETGHLVLSTIHTFGACESIDRIINVFPKERQEEIKLQLSLVLKGVIWQKLIKRSNGKGRCAAMEVMKVIPAIKNLIREGKTYQIQSIIQTGSKYGMITMERCMELLYKKGIISREEMMMNSSKRVL